MGVAYDVADECAPKKHQDSINRRISRLNVKGDQGLSAENRQIEWLPEHF
jgi:hypothetical protein